MPVRKTIPEKRGNRNRTAQSSSQRIKAIERLCGEVSYKPNIKLSGVLNIDLGTPLTGLNSTGYKIGFERGRKNFELVNHLGNVLVTISDKKIGVDNNSDTLINYYLADVVSASDYYPGGMGMPGRTYNAGTGYRYGFNGQEKDTTINPSHYTAEFWEYDSRNLRRWNVDPRSDESISPYNCFAGNPVWFSDPLGDTIKIYGTAEATNTTLTDKGGTGDQPQNTIIYKDAKLVPAINPQTNQLVGYHVFDTKDADRQMPALQIEPGDMEVFKTNYNNLMTAARLYYSSGEPSEGMKKYGAAFDFGTGTVNWKLAWSGIKQENKAAWSNPVFVAQVLLSTAHMSVDIAGGPFFKPNGGTIKDDFISEHSYNKHSYQAGIPSTRNRTQFGQNISIKKITEATIKYGVREVQRDLNGNAYAIKYSYEFKGNVSTANTPTGKVRVFINLNDASRSSVFPLYR